MIDRNDLPLGRHRTAYDMDLGAEAGCQVRVSFATEDPAWDAFLVETPGGHHVQTSLWAQVKAVLGWRPARVVVARDERIVAGAQLLIRSLPVVGAVSYVSRGPLFAVEGPVLTDLVMNALHQVARAHRLQYMIIQPPDNGTAVAHRLPHWGFAPSAIEVAPTATLLIDLTQDLDDILAQMRQKTRQYIRRGLRSGITVREGTELDLCTFYRLVLATSRRQNFLPYPEEYFRTMWRVFSPHGYVRLFLAEFEGEAVSALLVVPFGDTVLTKTIGWSGHHGNYHPNEVLHWAVIKWAKSQGYRYCDLEGIDTEAARALLRGESLPDRLMRTPTFFKLGFGGQVTLFPKAYDHVYNPILRWAYSHASPKIASLSIVNDALNRLRTHRARTSLT